MPAQLTNLQASLVKDLTAISSAIPAHLRKSLGGEFSRLLSYENLSLDDHVYLVGKRPKAKSPVEVGNVFLNGRRFRFYFAENTTENEIFGAAGMASLSELSKLLKRQPSTLKMWQYSATRKDRDGWVTARHSLTPDGGIIKFIAREDWELLSESKTLAQATSIILEAYQRTVPGRRHK